MSDVRWCPVGAGRVSLVGARRRARAAFRRKASAARPSRRPRRRLFCSAAHTLEARSPHSTNNTNPVTTESIPTARGPHSAISALWNPNARAKKKSKGDTSPSSSSCAPSSSSERPAPPRNRRRRSSGASSDSGRVQRACVRFATTPSRDAVAAQKRAPRALLLPHCPSRAIRRRARPNAAVPACAHGSRRRCHCWAHPSCRN